MRLDGKRIYEGDGQWYELTVNELLTREECEKLHIKFDRLEKIRTKVCYIFGKRFEVNPSADW